MNPSSDPVLSPGGYAAMYGSSSSSWRGPSFSSYPTSATSTINNQNTVSQQWGNTPLVNEPPSNQQTFAVPARPMSNTPSGQIPRREHPRDKKVDPSPGSGGIPNPTSEYLRLSNYPPVALPEPQHLLVVIDLNGTLLFRPSRKTPTKFTPRPYTRRFLEYCIETFTVVIWSSAQPENVKNMCNSILTPTSRQRVVAIWGRDKFDLTPQDYTLRVQCYKRLTKLWNDYQIQKSHPDFATGSRWNQTNTVLVDDSVEKGRSEPFNILEIPEFFGDVNEKGEILPQVHDYLNHLSMHSNVSACLRTKAFKTLVR